MELIKVIHAELPQIQCGRCDTPGCYQYAEEISKGAPHDRCVPGGDQTLGKLNKILNKNIKEVDMDYGPSIPLQIAVIDENECIGCKKCIDACPVDAISGSANEQCRRYWRPLYWRFSSKSRRSLGLAGGCPRPP